MAGLGRSWVLTQQVLLIHPPSREVLDCTMFPDFPQIDQFPKQDTETKNSFHTLNQSQ